MNFLGDKVELKLNNTKEISLVSIIRNNLNHSNKFLSVSNKFNEDLGIKKNKITKQRRKISVII